MLYYRDLRRQESQSRHDKVIEVTVCSLAGCKAVTGDTKIDTRMSSKTRVSVHNSLWTLSCESCCLLSIATSTLSEAV